MSRKPLFGRSITSTKKPVSTKLLFDIGLLTVNVVVLAAITVSMKYVLLKDGEYTLTTSPTATSVET
jgi:hypothetical protein